MCEEPNVKKECQEKSALCKEVETGRGYECYCDKPFEFNINQTACISKCLVLSNFLTVLSINLSSLFNMIALNSIIFWLT